MTSSTGPARRRHAPLAASLVVLALLAGCSSGDDTKANTTGSTASSTTAATSPGQGGHACTQGPTIEDVKFEAVDGVASDRTVTSFDGTQIRIHWFPAPQASKAKPAPTILMGPGWGQPGDTSTEKSAIFGALGIGGLNEQGYNVLTWDPRGFGESTGKANVDSPDFEGRDAQVLLDWVAEQPEVQLDRPGDPRVGMAGWSYGGGIQFVTAALDCRVDVIAPGIAWNSLVTSLGKAQTFKEGWAGLLVSTVKPGSVDPHVTSAYEAGLNTGTIAKATQDWYADRGPGSPTGLLDKVTVPTLILQGTVDTLFTLDEGVSNYRNLEKRGVPVKMVWFCGGHGACLTDAGDSKAVEKASMAWFARYLKGDESVDTGPAVDVIDQNGKRWTGDDYPPKAAAALTGSGSGALELTDQGGAGATTATPDGSDIVGGFARKITPGPATNAADVEITSEDEALVVGAPKLTIAYSGTSPAGERPTRVFAQLVDPTTNLVLGNQITPIEVTLDGKEHTAKVDLEIVAHHLAAGGTLRLQLVATTVAYGVPRLGGSIDFRQISIELPTTKALEPA